MIQRPILHTNCGKSVAQQNRPPVGEAYQTKQDLLAGLRAAVEDKKGEGPPQQQSDMDEDHPQEREIKAQKALISGG